MSDPDTRPDEHSISVEEFARLPEEDLHRVELVRGRIVREPRPGTEHGWMLMRLGGRLQRFVDEHDLGIVAADIGVRLPTDPPTVRGPDLAFIARETLPSDGVPTGFLDAAPDLAIEIVSPSNTAREIREKVLDYLSTGTRAVWVVDPRARRVTVHGSRSEVRILTAAGGDVLEGGDVLPGFLLRLDRLFAV